MSNLQQTVSVGLSSGTSVAPDLQVQFKILTQKQKQAVRAESSVLGVSSAGGRPAGKWPPRSSDSTIEQRTQYAFSI